MATSEIISLVQLVTDFGRTGNLIQTARFRLQAKNESLTSVRAQIVLAVRSAYYGVLGADAVLRVAQAALSNRELLLRQINALSQSSLRFDSGEASNIWSIWWESCASKGFSSKV